jgi:hypothetical protein
MAEQMMAARQQPVQFAGIDVNKNFINFIAPPSTVCPQAPAARVNRRPTLAKVPLAPAATRAMCPRAHATATEREQAQAGAYAPPAAVYKSLRRTTNGHICTLDSGGVLVLHL